MLLSLCFVGAWLTPPVSFESDLQALTDGVSKVAKPGLPGVVSAISKDSVPFLVAKDGKALIPVASAGHLGKGRVVAFGQGGYLSTTAASENDTAKMLANVIQWCAGRAGKLRVGYLGLGDGAGLMTKLGFDGVALNRASLADDLKRVDVAIIPAEFEAPGIEAYVRNGGGLVTGHTPWGWMQLNPGKSLATEMPMQDLLHKAGLSFSDGYAESQISPPKSAEESENCNAGFALDQLNTSGAQASTTVIAVLRSTTDRDPFQIAVRKKAAEAENKVPTEKTPITAKDALPRLALTIRQLDRESGKPSAKVEPSAADFPGAVPAEAPRVDATVSISLAKRQWDSTGLYAAPGEEISVEVPQELADHGLKLQIGCHTDELWGLDQWKRHPQIVTSKPIKQTTTRLSSPFGGLVYIVVDRTQPGPDQKVVFSNVVRSARYVHGKTSLDEWKKQLQYNAPWAEIGSDRLIFSVPVAEARKVADPSALMDLWDKIIALYSDLDGSPIFDRPERIVCDRQISAGYMHSGYPIMTWMDDSVPLSLDATRLTTQGTWGHWHELGHNRQKSVWTYEGTGEVTNNIFTVYMMYNVAKKPIFDRLGKETPKFQAYIAKGGDFEQWKSDPFLALYMYMQLVDGFGWDSMKKYFRSYAEDHERWNDLQKHDQFLIHSSHVVGRNLSAFFQAWAIPTSEAARDSLKDLPTWLPKDFPKSPHN